MSMEMNNKPRNIFEAINMNVVEMSQDLVEAYKRLDAMQEKLDMIYDALYPPMEEPNATGGVLSELTSK